MTDSEILAANCKLSDAQEMVARQQGFDSWQALKTGLSTPSLKVKSSPFKATIVSAESQLFVTDIKRSCEFFREKLGFSLVFSYGKPPYYALSAGPSDSTSRWTPCPPKYSKRWLQVGLGCVQLSPSCPFRRLHTFRFLRPARLRTPLLGYGAPHLSARGTSTLLNNALLSARFLFADNPGVIPPDGAPWS
jgi:hypothetical protein